MVRRNRKIGFCPLLRFLLIFIIGIPILLGLNTPQEEKSIAKQILDATGIKGGLILHFGCGDGKLTAALRLNDSYLVHGLDPNPENVETARKYILSLGIYGKVSVDCWNGNYLPYIDNLVNLVVSENLANIPISEVMRVLSPNGVAYIKKDGKWTKIVKPRPNEIDDWTHFFYDSKNNPVADDSVVGPPRRFQFTTDPIWSRHHDHMASMSSLVSSNGRIFYICDEGSRASIRLPPKWFLVAKDAFNSTLLWKKELTSWVTHLWPLKSGPVQMTRRLVASGDRVYVTLGLDAPLSCLDAATGNIVRTYEGTKNTEEIIFSEGVLFLLVNESPSKWLEYRQKFTYVWANSSNADTNWAWDEKERWIVAVQANSGKILWKKQFKVAPLTLSSDSQYVYFYDGTKVIALNRKNGDEIWSSEAVTRRAFFSPCFGPRLVVYKDVVVFAGGDRKMTALSSKNGQKLWTADHPPSGHRSPEDLFVIDGLVWSGATADPKNSGTFTGRDLYTGEIKSEFPPDINIYWFHHRCHPSKATNKYILCSRTGVEFVDFRAKHWITHHWVRGGCIYGIMPANGLIYVPPQSCGCYLESKLCGFNALAPESKSRPDLTNLSDKGRLEAGPAYGQPVKSYSQKDDWPTYRADPFRSGFNKTFIPDDSKSSWNTKIGPKLSSLVVAEGKVFVSKIDQHTIYALDANSGKILWTYTTGGRVDSPPTIYNGMVVFGCRDGYVYCLRATDGKLIWRFRAAPRDERMVAFNQIESVWPVHGSVLVQNGVVYCVAGRSAFLDGGMRFLRLEVETGRKISESILDDKDPETGQNLQVHVKGLVMPVALPDILSSDGKYVYMRSQQFDLEGNRLQIPPRIITQQEGEGVHLLSNIGFLDDSWFHRSFWEFGKSFSGGYGSWFRTGRFVPSGRILVFDENWVYGYGRKPEYMCNASVLEYNLFAAYRDPKDRNIQILQKSQAQINAASKEKHADHSDWKLRQGFPIEMRTAVDYRWLLEKPTIIVRAMVLTEGLLLLAGPPDVVDEEQAFYNPDDVEIKKKLQEQAESLEGKKGALLLAISTLDGRKLIEYKLDSPPVWDGMAVANGGVYLSTLDGNVICLKDTRLKESYEEVKKAAKIYKFPPRVERTIMKTPTKLCLSYSFEDGTAKDESGNNNHGTVEGARSVDGKLGKAFLFDGKSYVKVQKSDTLNPASTPFVVEAWLKAEKGEGVILARGGGVHGYAIFLKDGKPYFSIRVNKELTSVSSEEDVVGKWTHIAGVLTEKGDLKIYLNGKLAESTKLAKFIQQDPYEAMEIGTDMGSQVGDYEAKFYFTGIIDEIKIYRGELSEDEIKEHYEMLR